VQKDFLQHNLPEEDIRLGSRATFSAWRHGGSRIETACERNSSRTV